MKKAVLFLLLIFSQSFAQKQILKFYGLEDPSGKSHLFYRLQDATNLNIMNFNPDSLTSSVLTKDESYYISERFTPDFEYAKDSTALIMSWRLFQRFIGILEAVVQRQKYGGYSVYPAVNSNGFNIETSDKNPALVYASHSGEFNASRSRLIKSTDAGRTWSPTGNDFYLLSLNKNDDKILFGRDSKFRLVMSKDEGKTSVVIDSTHQWQDYDVYYQTSINLRNDYVKFYYSKDGMHIYAVAQKDSKYHLMRSADNGYTWESILQEDFPIFISLDGEDPSLIYIALENKLFHSYGFGYNFEFDRLYPNTIAGIYKTPDTKKLYVATQYALFETAGGSTKKLLDLHDVKDTSKATWTLYNSKNSSLPYFEINCIMVDKDNVKWVGGQNLAKFDDAAWTVYTQAQVPYYRDLVDAMLTDRNNFKWFCAGTNLYKLSGDTWFSYTDGTIGGQGGFTYNLVDDSKGNKWLSLYYWSSGLKKFDGVNWTWYTTSNSPLPHYNVNALAVDKYDNVWIGTEKGLAKFDGISTWKIFNKSNSGLPSDTVTALAIDSTGNVWAGTKDAGLAKYDGQTWTVYNTSNSGLPSNAVTKIVIDNDGNKCLISGGAVLVKFDNKNWTVYSKASTGLAYSHLNCIAVDKYNYKWMGSEAGLIRFLDPPSGNYNSVTEGKAVVKEFSLLQNYPNPFNPSTTISYSIPKGRLVTLKVYDLLGKEVAALVNEYKEAGTHSMQFNASSLPSGIYIYTMEAGEFRDSKKLVLLK